MPCGLMARLNFTGVCSVQSAQTTPLRMRKMLPSASRPVAAAQCLFERYRWKSRDIARIRLLGFVRVL